MTRIKTSRLQAREMYKLYLTGASIKEVASDFGVADHHVRYAFKAAGLQLKPPRRPQKRRPSADEMYEHYQTGATLRGTAEEFGVPLSYVSKAFEAAGLHARFSGGDRALAKQRVEAMHKQYIEGATLQQIGEHAGITRERVRQLFTKAGLETRTPGVAGTHRTQVRAERAEAEHALIAQQFRESNNIQTLADQHDLSIDRIKRILKAKLSAQEYLDVPTGASPKHYSDEDLVDFLRKAAGGDHGPLTVARYSEVARRSRKSWASVQTYVIRFGSWTSALQAAGVPARNPPLRSGPIFDRDACLAAVRAVTEALGKMPTGGEYDRRARESRGSEQGPSTSVK
jgi:transposase